MKNCATCNENKPYSDFHPRARASDGYASICKDCDRKRQREFYHANKERLKPIKAQRAKEWYEQNKETHIEKVTARKQGK